MNHILEEGPCSTFPQPGSCANPDKSVGEMMVLRIFLLTGWFHAATAAAWGHRPWLGAIKVCRVSRFAASSEGVVSGRSLRLSRSAAAPSGPNHSLFPLISKPQAGPTLWTRCVWFRFCDSKRNVFAPCCAHRGSSSSPHSPLIVWLSSGLAW